MARNPTGCDVKKTCLNVVLTLGAMVALSIGDHFASPPTSRITPAGTVYVMAVTEKNMNLTCDVSGVPWPTITWYRDESLLQTRSCSNQLDEKSDFCMGENNNKRLTLKKAAANSGSYWCIAKNVYGTAVSEKVSLFIKEVIHSRRTEVIHLREHESWLIKVPHAFQNGLNGIYSWTPVVDRFLVTSTGQLFLSDVLASDNGRKLSCWFLAEGRLLSCGRKVLNVTPSQNKEAESHLNCSHCDRHSHLTFLEGDDVILDCLVSGVPQPDVKWTFNDDTVGHGLQLELGEATQDKAGHYRCTAENKAGQMTKDYTVKVEKKPAVSRIPNDVIKNVNELGNSSVEFYCNGTGNPSLQTQWFINQEKVQGNTPVGNYDVTATEENGVLRITDIKSEVFATIHCNLSNSHGYLWFQARLSITGKKTTKAVAVTKTTKGIPEMTTKPTPSSTTKMTTTPTTSSSIPSTTQSTTAQPTTASKSTIQYIPAPDQEPNFQTPTHDTSTIVGHVENTDIVVEVKLKWIFISIGVGVVIVVIVAIICTILCVRACQKKNHREEEQRYPRSVSNLSYISHLQRIRDFDDRTSDRASEDSGIDERSHMKSKISIPLGENQDNQRNEIEQMISLEDVV